jgi:hypothetical protein
MGLFSSNKSSQTTNLNDSSVNMADQAVYMGAGTQYTETHQTNTDTDIEINDASAGGLILKNSSIDASVHNTLDGELARFSMQAVTDMAKQSMSGVAAASAASLSRGVTAADEQINAAAGVGDGLAGDKKLIYGAAAAAILALILMRRRK